MDDLQMLATALATPDLTAEAIDRGRGRLRKKMRGPARRRRFVWPAASLGLTAAAAAAAIVIASDATAPTPTSNSPGAALPGRQVLLAAATSAERTPEGSGKYWHVKTVFSDRSAWPETWTRRDGSKWWKGEKTGGKLQRLVSPTPFRLGGPDVSFDRLQRLPTAPGALKAWIANSVEHSDVRTSAGRPNAAVRGRLVFDGLISLVSQLPAPPKVRAAAFRAIATYPGVKGLGAVGGGQGLLIPLGDGMQARLVVDPVSSRVRDTNVFVTDDGGEVWLPGAHRATVTAGWTNTLPR
jgi:hypothetical protein